VNVDFLNEVGLNDVDDIIIIGSREQDLLGTHFLNFQVVLYGFQGCMISLLEEDFVCFVINYYLQVRKVRRLPFVLQKRGIRRCNDDLPLV
jgi:hypothetical protein